MKSKLNAKRKRKQPSNISRYEQHRLTEKYSKEIENDFYGLQKDIWRFIRRQRTDLKELIWTTEIDDETWD